MTGCDPDELTQPPVIIESSSFHAVSFRPCTQAVVGRLDCCCLKPSAGRDRSHAIQGRTVDPQGRLVRSARDSECSLLAHRPLESASISRCVYANSARISPGTASLATGDRTRRSTASGPSCYG